MLRLENSNATPPCIVQPLRMRATVLRRQKTANRPKSELVMILREASEIKSHKMEEIDVYSPQPTISNQNGRGLSIIFNRAIT